MQKRLNTAFSAAFAVAVWLFWWLRFPYDLGFQEQNQLLLFTRSYAADALADSGGLACLVAEFITQFYCIKWLGALLLAGVFLLLQLMVWKAARTIGAARDCRYRLSFLPSAVLLVHMGDIYAMLAFPVALILALAAFLPLSRLEHKTLYLILTIPAGFWLIGPAIYITVALHILTNWNYKRAQSLWTVAYTAAVVALFYNLFQTQFPIKDVIFGIEYYRMPVVLPPLQLAVAILTALVPWAMAKLPEVKCGPLHQSILFVVLLGATFCFTNVTFDRDTHELIAYDQMVRSEDWNGIISSARKHPLKSEPACVCLNLSLMMTGQLQNMFDFYQCGVEGLVMPRVRDLISNVGSYEAFWRLGFVNTAMRYAFDSQESEGNNQKSGRHTSKLVECHIVNGNYAVAAKYINILKHSLFYRSWALDMEKFLYNDAAVESHPVYGYLRYSRFHDDFLYNYGEMDKMLAILYNINKNNVMAGYYFQAYKNLEKMGGDR